ncbi:MAG: rpoE [Gammaproteobacteria bacterium]|nr:rpoE [Gammaproteobacteria bacterium]
MRSNETDQILVARVQQGDKAAFDVLVLRYQSRINSLVSRFLRNQNDALDITQEAFLKAYRALPNFRGDSAFFTWLYRIAINTAKNYLTMQSRRAAEVEQDLLEIEQIDGDNVLKDQATPEHLLLTDEIQATIISAIEQLPD